jgi:photosystem II stability/assembly factor-like uncharacterized protein
MLGSEAGSSMAGATSIRGGAGGSNDSRTTGGGAGTPSSAAGSGGTGQGGSARADAGGVMVTVVSRGTPGVWENVTPAGINLDKAAYGLTPGGDNCGVEDVLVDPVKPSDLYAFACFQGVWRSTDFGYTWTQLRKDSPWQLQYGSAIDPSTARDPNTPPTLYTGGSNATGIFKSTDGGVSWTSHRLPDSFGDFSYQEVYTVNIDPYDNQHLLVGFHIAKDIGESTDGGITWSKSATPDADGSLYYAYFIDTGEARTTRLTWLAVPMMLGKSRTLRTTDGGKTWTRLDMFQHVHGNSQIFDAGGGRVYLAGVNPTGLFKSTDYGATFTKLAEGTGAVGEDGSIVATSKFFYASAGEGWGTVASPLSPGLQRAPRGSDATWSTVSAPGMVDGSKRIAVTHDAAHSILVGGNWHAGIWRYVEP